MNRILLHIILSLIVSVLGAQEHYKIKRTDFSTNYFNEFSPVQYKDGLVYCTDRNSKVFVHYKNTRGNNLLDMHFVKYKGNLKWSSSKKFPEELLTNYNEGPACFSSDGNTIYFTKSIDSEKNFNNLRGDSTYGIFTAELIDDVWGNIKPFKYNRKTDNTGFPMLSSDGNTLYFCSTMRGGKGGLDIWYVTKKGRNWGKAINLESVNTEKNEVTPFIHPSGRLYFASNGYNGREDTDILYTDFINEAWTDPVALEAPFNSRSDDFGFIVSADWDTGFYSSNKRGSDDIFQFYSEYPSFTEIECPEQKENDYCYVFFEEGSIEVDTTSLKYEWDLGDGTRIRGLEASHCFSGPGNYLIQLNVIDTLTGEIYFSEAAFDFLLEDTEQPYIDVADTLVLGSETTLDASKTYLKNFEVGNYFWDLNYGELKTGEAINYQFPYPGEYTVRLGVTSTVADRKEEPEKKCVTRKVVVIETEKTKNR